jgi:hypothetical protein
MKGVRTILSAKTYIHNMLGKLESMFDGGPFKKCSTPMMEAYHPETDDTPLLDGVNHSKYRAMIGSANWAITLGRLDSTYPTNTLARYSMGPREGHLIVLKRLFGYLCKHPDGQILIDPNPNPMDHTEALKNLHRTTTGENSTRKPQRSVRLANQNLEQRKPRSLFMSMRITLTML